MPLKDPIARKEYGRKSSREYYAKNKAAIYAKSQKYRVANREKYREYKNEYDRELRRRVMEHYGGNIPACVCCVEREAKFLALDHVNGGGTKSRRAHHGSMGEYAWVIKNGFPTDYFQVMCHNCNMAKGFWGKCPHTN